MQKRKNKIRNIAIVLSNIFMVISLILALILKNNYGYTLYWIIVPFLLILILSIVLKWSVRGLNADTEESKTIQRAFDDSTTLLTVFFGVSYILIQGIEAWSENLTKNPILIICFFIIMAVYELFTYLAIYNAKKETAELLEKKYNKKKK